MTYKIGQKVRVVREHPQSNYDGKPGVLTSIGESHHTYPYLVKFDNDYITGIHQIEPIEPVLKTWDTLQKGDMLIDEDKDEYKVLGVFDDLVTLSYASNHDSVDDWYTKQQLQKYGWKIKQEEVIEMTKEEITGIQVNQSLVGSEATVEVGGKKYKAKIISEE